MITLIGFALSVLAFERTLVGGFHFLTRPKAESGVGTEFSPPIARRALILVALGLVLNLAAAAPDVASLRVPGVLQRIGVVYLAAALIGLHTRPVARFALAIEAAALTGTPVGVD